MEERGGGRWMAVCGGGGDVRRPDSGSVVCCFGTSQLRRLGKPMWLPRRLSLAPVHGHLSSRARA